MEQTKWDNDTSLALK